MTSTTLRRSRGRRRRVLLSKRSDERVEERTLLGADPSRRLVDAVPGAAIDLRILLLLPRARRPLHFELVAPDLVRVEIAPHRPRAHDLPALLLDLAERVELAVDGEP